jgi:hypothetical protein
MLERLRGMLRCGLRGGRGRRRRAARRPRGAVESPCEAEIQACDDAGGSNTECLEVLGTCLEAAGVPADDPYLVCLGALTGCVGPAEASDDPDTALTDCAEAFNVCVGRG